jgi:hypothetical protein
MQCEKRRERETHEVLAGPVLPKGRARDVHRDVKNASLENADSCLRPSNRKTVHKPHIDGREGKLDSVHEDHSVEVLPRSGISGFGGNVDLV